MTKILSGFILILILGSCYRTEKDPSFNMNLVLPADSMVTLLTDLHLADGVIIMLKDKKQPIKHLSNEYLEAVLQKHSVDTDQFEESMRYYAYHTEELDDVYERVITELSKKESLVISKKETDTISNDSLP